MRKLLLVALVLVGLVAGGRAALDSMVAPGSAAEGPDRAPREFILLVTPERTAEGTVYHVRPTRAGRLAGRPQLDTAWRQAVSRGVPDRANLRQQFLCHPLSMVARAKPTWDLEAWRPAVGGLRTMFAACNP